MSWGLYLHIRAPRLLSAPCFIRRIFTGWFITAGTSSAFLSDVVGVEASAPLWQTSAAASRDGSVTGVMWWRPTAAAPQTVKQTFWTQRLHSNSNRTQVKLQQYFSCYILRATCIAAFNPVLILQQYKTLCNQRETKISIWNSKKHLEWLNTNT